MGGEECGGRGGGGRGGKEEGHSGCEGGCRQARREEPGERWSAGRRGAVWSWGEEEGAC